MSKGTAPAARENYCVFEGSFPTAPRWIEDEPDPEHPPGREVIELLLRAADPGLALDEIWSHEGFGWSFNCAVRRTTVNVLIQHPGHWLLIVRAVGILPRFWKGQTYDRAAREVATRLHSGLVASDRVVRLRWFTEDGYDDASVTDRFF
ncbi:MAG TPA: hypothetical protein VF384_13090 [Planctomycetota bacterium]